jgi:hypothetical protein
VIGKSIVRHATLREHLSGYVLFPDYECFVFYIDKSYILISQFVISKRNKNPVFFHHACLVSCGDIRILGDKPLAVVGDGVLESFNARRCIIDIVI